MPNRHTRRRIVRRRKYYIDWANVIHLTVWTTMSFLLVFYIMATVGSPEINGRPYDPAPPQVGQANADSR